MGNLKNNFQVFHPHMSKTQMVKNEREKHERESKFETKEIKEHIPLEVLDWALKEIGVDSEKKFYKAELFFSC